MMQAEGCIVFWIFNVKFNQLMMNIKWFCI